MLDAKENCVNVLPIVSVTFVGATKVVPARHPSTIRLFAVTLSVVDTLFVEAVAPKELDETKEMAAKEIAGPLQAYTMRTSGTANQRYLLFITSRSSFG